MEADLKALARHSGTWDFPRNVGRKGNQRPSLGEVAFARCGVRMNCEAK